VEVAPWIAEKVIWIEMDVQALADDPTSVLPAGTTIVAIHACGNATDLCIQAGVKLGSTLVLMPCCYQPPPPLAGGFALPSTIEFELGIDLACDIHRTYRLQAMHGYAVDWAAIPKAITPKNRLVIGTPGKGDSKGGTTGAGASTWWLALGLIFMLMAPRMGSIMPASMGSIMPARWKLSSLRGLLLKR
jgi:hypothetical protein